MDLFVLEHYLIRVKSLCTDRFHSDKEQKRHPILMLLDILELFYKSNKLEKVSVNKNFFRIIGRGELGRLPAYILQS